MKKPIKGKVKLIGLEVICPYCGKPSEDISLEKIRTKEKN